MRSLVFISFVQLLRRAGQERNRSPCILVSHFIHRKIPGKGTNNPHMVLAPAEFVGDWLDGTHRVPPVQPALLPRARKLLIDLGLRCLRSRSPVPAPSSSASRPAE